MDRRSGSSKNLPRGTYLGSRPASVICLDDDGVLDVRFDLIVQCWRSSDRAGMNRCQTRRSSRGVGFKFTMINQAVTGALSFHRVARIPDSRFDGTLPHRVHRPVIRSH